VTGTPKISAAKRARVEARLQREKDKATVVAVHALLHGDPKRLRCAQAFWERTYEAALVAGAKRPAATADRAMRVWVKWF